MDRQLLNDLHRLHSDISLAGLPYGRSWLYRVESIIERLKARPSTGVVEMLPIMDELYDVWKKRPASREKFPIWWGDFQPIIHRILRIRKELKEAGA